MDTSSKTLVFTLAILCLNMMSCEGLESETSRERIVISAFGETLSLDQLSTRIPDEMSLEDSTLMAERIIEGWIREHVLLSEVEKNISEFNHDFEADVTAYRNALLVSHFESRYVASRLDGNVEENEIERAVDIVVRTVANKKNNKIYIIQSLDKKMNLDDIARGKTLTIDELLSEIENIVESGTKINLSHIIDEMMDDEELNEIHDFFKTTENFSFDEARQEFDEDEFNDDEIRILRIDFISKVGN